MADLTREELLKQYGLIDHEGIEFVDVQQGVQISSVPVWTGSAEEAEKLLSEMPSGPGRFQIKRMTFHLRYGMGPSALRPPRNPPSAEVMKILERFWNRYHTGEEKKP